MPHTIIIWRSFCLNISCLFPEITHFVKLPLKLAVINVRVKRLYFQHFSIVFAVGLAIIGLAFVLIVFFVTYCFGFTAVINIPVQFKLTFPGSDLAYYL